MSSPQPSPARAFLAHVKRGIDARLVWHLAAARARAAEAGPSAEVLARAIEDLVHRGGKRFRPALLAAAWVACGGTKADALETLGELPQPLLDAGCAWELLQAYFLIHDDWMDDDDTRRGGPSVHVHLTTLHRDAKLGASSAILAGDLACALAHRILLETDAPEGVLRAASAAFARIHEEVVLGQSIDLTLAAADRASVERMHALKTGSYTVRGPLEVGALLARSSPAARAALERYAKPLGVAFQLRDDLLGTFGDASETGKPVGSDLRARKRTALVVEATSRLTGDDAMRFERMIASTTTPADDDVRWAIALLQSSGARSAVEARLSSLVAEACTAARDEALTPAGRELLVGFADLLGARSV
jgi:geranylgeranyl diphosphate synthase type I